MAELLDVPMVLVSPAGPVHTQAQLLGNPFNPSYQPVVGTPLIDPTAFTQRLGKSAAGQPLQFKPSYQLVVGNPLIDPTAFTQRLGKSSA